MSSSSRSGARAALSRIVAARRQVLAAATLLLVVAGSIAALTDHPDLALVAVLLLQGAIAAYLVTAPTPGAVGTPDVRDELDRATTRTLADITRTRQAILDALDETAGRDAR